LEEDVVETKKLDLRDDPEVLSPPTVSPAYGCGTAVTVTGFVPHAKLELEIAGVSVATAQAGYPDPDGFTFTGIGPLSPGEVIRARQESGGVTSPWSAPQTVMDHSQEYPAGPPRPEIAPSPVFECGSRTGVANLLTGCNVWITADGTEVGRVDGAKEHQGVNVNPDYGLNQQVRAWAELCGDPSPPSQSYNSGPAPNPLPVPAIDDVFDGGERIRITNLVNGARFRVTRGGSTSGPYRTWGAAHLVTMTPAVSTGETIEVVQTMCPSNPSSDPGSTVVLPCSELPAPTVHPIEVGAPIVVVTGWVAGAQIKVFQGMQKIGDGGPPVVVLTQPIQPDTPVYVIQVVGSCTSRFARVVTPRCVAPPTGGDPAGRNLFPVGFKDYADGPYKGSVYYPAEDDGEDQPFNKRWGDLGRSPIVVMAHGNHYTYYNPKNREDESCGDPGDWTEIGNHTGYRYLQTQLARMGFIAVSVDCNATNCTGNSLQNIEDRAELILGSLNHFKDLDSSGDAIFGDRIDFGQVGFMGHSRGGEAVVIAGNQAGSIGATSRAVISLAPVNHNVYVPADYAYMTILPANDGDVSSNPGAMFYDLAGPAPFKSQIYADYANHNYFNREWVLDEDLRLPPDVLDRVACERILSRYGCALFRTFMMGHDLADYLTYRRHPSGIDTSKVHLSFERMDQILVDNHEQPSGIGTNSMGQTTSQSMGLSADEYHLTPGGSYSPSTFYGDTSGMVIEGRAGGIFRSPLDGSYDLSAEDGRLFEVWVRVAEVSNGGSNPPDAIGFELGIEDGSGQRAWANSAAVGGVPRPFDDGPPSGTKSMMSTLRFPIRCFRPEEGGVKTGDIVALLVRLNQPEPRPLALDVLQLVKT
jgi:hypothetical protein